ncbi:hypothetical protein L3X38_035961 [Prunus dulcis]|uniref:Uncharacterized protein n=1 Tax=Prunus dulcis TaxID=3755 RepID=A0AAD4YYC0_PRUDU|nr:hypothetical protein L3X38_035961 [Prunus dulcis]
MGCAFSSSSTRPWIIAFEASDHMTNDSSWFLASTAPHRCLVKVVNDLVKKTTIGIGKEKGDLYYFEETDSVGHVFQIDGDYTSEPCSQVFSWATLLSKRVTSVFILPLASTVSMDVEFQEHTSYFSQEVPNSLLYGEHLVHLEFSDYLIKLLVDEILGLNQSGADLQTDIEPQGESPSAVKGKENSKVL